MRPEVGIVEDDQVVRRIVPDLAVVQNPTSGLSAVGILEEARTEISESLQIRVASEPLQHTFVEVRDPSRGHELVALLEIVGPSNKLPGPDRQAYLRKQKEILGSPVHWIEIDLLREGQRLSPHPEIHGLVEQMSPRPDYLVLVNRAWQREPGDIAWQIFPIRVTETLPCFPVPLKVGEEVPVDLQFAFRRAYDNGPYRRGAVDYSQPPPLPAELMDWGRGRLKEAGWISE